MFTNAVRLRGLVCRNVCSPVALLGLPNPLTFCPLRRIIGMVKPNFNSLTVVARRGVVRVGATDEAVNAVFDSFLFGVVFG